MKRFLPGWLITVVLVLLALGMGLLLPEFVNTPRPAPPQQQVQEVAQAATATQTIPPRTPLATLTSRATLKPPPTLEPPTPTPFPTDEPTATLTPTFVLDVTVEGLVGLPSPTVPSADTCEKNADWQLEYEIRVDDTLSSIADAFGISTTALADGNCLENPDLIRAGQRLLVPGDVLPSEDICGEYQLFTPIQEAWLKPMPSTVTLNWRGPETYRSLVRMYPPDFDFSNPKRENWVERTIDLKTDVTFEACVFDQGGRWQWEVVPLNIDFVQVCPTSPRWAFHVEDVDERGNVCPSAQPDTGGVIPGGNSSTAPGFDNMPGN